MDKYYYINFYFIKKSKTFWQKDKSRKIDKLLFKSNTESI